MPGERIVVKVGTRGSELALWQADHVIARLQAAWPGLEVTRTIVRTRGDDGLSGAGALDKGMFTRELEEALRDGRVDLAVHSLKDLPTDVPDGLALAAVLEREDPRDALVSATRRGLAGLRRGARVGTSSPRRKAQLLALRPDLAVVDVRGNVPTRLEKMLRGEFDAVLLAWAGLARLGLTGLASELLDAHAVLPAPGQGAIAVQALAGARGILRLAQPLTHIPTLLATTAERALLARLEGGCRVPIGALARLHGDVLALDAIVAALDGEFALRASHSTTVTTLADAARLGEETAERLLDLGAAGLLAEARTPGTLSIGVA